MTEIFSRYLKILNCFVSDREIVRITQSECAERIGLPIASVHRLIADLVEAEFLQRDPDAKYRLGPALPRLLEKLCLAESRTARRFADLFNHVGPISPTEPLCPISSPPEEPHD